MILGHQWHWDFLTKATEMGRLPHALLFSGQDQLGKRTLAIEFAKFLNCLSIRRHGLPAGKQACQVCRNCRDIDKGIFPDFIFIKPDVSINSKTKKIGPAREIKISQIKISRIVQSNIVFAYFNPQIIPTLQEKYFFYVLDELKSEVRLMTSWDTTKEDVLSFVNLIKQVIVAKVK